MELFLNILWFSLAAGAVAALFRTYRRGQEKKRFLLGLGALLCAAALLFPAISITDDLHFNAFLVEDSNSTKRLANAVAHTSPIAQVAWFGLLAFAFLLISRERTWCVVSTSSAPYEGTPFALSVLGRAPPKRISA